MLGPRVGPRAILFGGVVATLPDLDSFLPAATVIDAATYHRGFSHSVFVQTAATPVIALLSARLFKLQHIPKALIVLTVWLCLITHSLLDCLTTYGTQIFWPFSSVPPIALPSVFIIDPTYTLLLLVGVLGFLFVFRKGRNRAQKFIQIFLALSTLYLGAGITAHYFVKSRAEANPLIANMKIHVQPTPLNIFYWQVLAVDKQFYYAGVTSLLRNCDFIELKRYPRLASIQDVIEVSPSVKRVEWWTNGFYSYFNNGDKLKIADLRIGFAPNFLFSYHFAKQAGNAYRAIRPERARSGLRSLESILELYKMAQIEPRQCTSSRFALQSLHR